MRRQQRESMKINNPKTKQVLVTYLDHDKSWYPAKVQSLLSVQFTADFKKGKEVKHGYYFYKDRNITWKDKEELSYEKKI